MKTTIEKIQKGESVPRTHQALKHQIINYLQNSFNIKT